MKKTKLQKIIRNPTNNFPRGLHPPVLRMENLERCMRMSNFEHGIECAFK